MNPNSRQIKQRVILIRIDNDDIPIRILRTWRYVDSINDICFLLSLHIVLYLHWLPLEQKK